MFSIISTMFLGIGIGYVLRNWSILQKTEKTISLTIFLLLFILGIEVGGNEQIIKGLHTIGLEAILLTLGNAMQVPFSRSSSDPISNYDGYYKPELDNGTNVAIGDSSMTDTLQQSLVTPSAPAAMPVLK